MNLECQYQTLLRLLFDDGLRTAFASDPIGALRGAGLDDADLAPLAAADPTGIELDADIRSDYLMAALCRSYPIAAAAVGAVPGGASRLRAFLATPALFVPVGERTRAFGEHIASLVPTLPAAAAALVTACLGLERARADNAAALRAAVQAGKDIPTPRRIQGNALKTARPKLPAFFLVAELPAPTALVASALHQVTPETAWRLVKAGDLDIDRLVSVARGDDVPVTVLCRGALVNPGQTSASLIEVTHHVAELPGRRGALLSGLDGTRKLSELDPPVRRLAKLLLADSFLDAS